jgi:hypothetical protein
MELFSFLGLAAGHLSPKKNSRVYIAYLYYLPFCMAFVSERQAPQNDRAIFSRR